MCYNCENPNYDPRGGFSQTQLYYMADYPQAALEAAGILAVR